MAESSEHSKREYQQPSEHRKREHEHRSSGEREAGRSYSHKRRRSPGSYSPDRHGSRGREEPPHGPRYRGEHHHRESSPYDRRRRTHSRDRSPGEPSGSHRRRNVEQESRHGREKELNRADLYRESLSGSRRTRDSESSGRRNDKERSPYERPRDRNVHHGGGLPDANDRERNLYNGPRDRSVRHGGGLPDANDKERNLYDRPRDRNVPHGRGSPDANDRGRNLYDGARDRSIRRSGGSPDANDRERNPYDRPRDRRIHHDRGSPYDYDRSQDVEKDRHDGPKRFRERPQNADAELPELYSVHRAKVQSVRPFGIFVQLDGFLKQGLVHLSQLSDHEVTNRDDSDEVKQRAIAAVAEEGDQVWVKVISLKDEGGNAKIGCSLKFVSQSSGEDLDPNNVKLEQQQQSRGIRQEHRKVSLDAIYNVVCSRCGGHGHLKTECYSTNNKQYELLPDVDDDLPTHGTPDAELPGKALAVPGMGRALPGMGRGRAMVLPAWMTHGTGYKLPQTLESDLKKDTASQLPDSVTTVEEALAVIAELGKEKKDKNLKKKRAKRHKKKKEYKRARKKEKALSKDKR